MLDRFGPEPPLITPEEFRSWVLLENDDVLVLNKPGWVVCHPSKNGPWSSLVGAAREILDGETVHLVSRLDRETSGLVILAKHRDASRRLQMALEKRNVRKTYLAVLEGQLVERIEVSRALEDDADSAVAVKQRVSETGTGAKAQTSFIPLRNADAFSLVRVVPHTGRKHQIRVHARSIGHPVVGDKLYGADENLYLRFIDEGVTQEMAEVLRHPRQLLHASRMVFELEGEELAFEAPATDDFAEFCEREFGCHPDTVELAGPPRAQRPERRRPRR